MTTKFRVKRSTVSGITPTTGDIDSGELAINIPDRKLFTSNGTAIFELGSNLNNLSVSGNLTIGSTGDIVLTPGAGIFANGSLGSNSNILYSNGTSVYWGTANAGISAVVSQQFTANGTANSFTVSGGYIPSAIEVYVAGVKQIPGTDVTITSGSTINFAVPPLNGQIVDVFGYQSVGGIGSFLALTGGTLTGNLTFTNGSVIIANGSFGTNGQVLTSNGTSLYWSSAGFANGQSISVNNFVVTGAFTANGANGTSGQVLTSNSTGVYWSTPTTGTVTSVATGNGLTGGPITSTGTVSVLANSGIVANSTGIFVNTAFIGTLSANNASFLGGTSAASYQLNSTLAANVATLTANNANNLNGQAASFYTNATNISTGTLANARLPSAIDVTSVNATSFGVTGTTIFSNSSLARTLATFIIPGASTEGGQLVLGYGNGLATSISGQSNNTFNIDVFGGNTGSTPLLRIFTQNGDGTTTSILNASNTGRVHVGSASEQTDSTFKVTGTANVTGNVTIGGISTFNANVILGSSGLSANGGFGTAGQVLSSNGTSVYWNTPTTGTVTSVATGNGLTGGPVTSTGTVSVLANSGIVANSTGVFVNTAFIGTLSANNASFLGGTAAASYQLNSTLAANVATLTANNANNLNGQAASFYTNASNLSTGTLPDARLSSAVVNTSSAFTITGTRTYNANVTFGSAAAFIANASPGTSGQVLTSNGTGVYWAAAAAGVNTAAQYAWTNTHTFAANVTFDSSTLFINAALDRVGVGTTSPEFSLHTIGAAEWPVALRASLNTTSNRTHYLAQRSLGTVASPTAVTSGTNLGGLGIGAYDGTNWSLGWNGGAEVSAFASQNWTPTARGTHLAFLNTPDSTTSITERMRIAANGFVGIGTSLPAHLLDVSGSGTQTIRAITTDTSGVAVGRLMAQYTGGGGGTASAIDIRAGDGYSYIVTTTNTAMLFGTNGSERMRIDTSGNIGIGTTTPITNNARLSVRASDDYSAGLTIGSQSTAANWARLDFKNTNAPQPAILYQDQLGTFSIRTEAAYPITLLTNGANERMRIAANGFVGIANTAPDATLAVTGTANVSGNVVIGGITTFNTANAIILPRGNTASRPAASNGMIRYNTNTSTIEAVANNVWTNMLAAYSSVREQFTASNNQTTFTVTGGYVPGQIDVYYNGVKLRSGSEVNISSGSTVVLAASAANNALIEVVGIGPTFVVSNTAQIAYQQFTASNNQTTFTVTNGYVPGQVDVFADGVKLVNGVDVNVSSGGSVVLSTGVPNNTIVEVKGYSTPLVSAQTSTAVRQTFTANATVNNNFTVTGGYIPGQVDVFYNGAKLVNGSDVNTSSGTTIVLTSNAASGAIVDVVGINYFTAGGGVTTPVRQQLVATANQTTFTITGGYTPGQIDVFRNGVRLTPGADVNISSGSSVVLVSPAANGDNIDVVGFAATSYQDSVRKSGDTISGSLGISANLAVTGAATFSNTIAVTGTSTLTGNVTTSGVFADPTGTIRPLVAATAQNSTSGTFIDFTGIPSWVRRITIVFSNVRTSGTSNPRVQIGSGSFTTTGYNSYSSYVANGGSPVAGGDTGGFHMNTPNSSSTRSGIMQLHNVAGNNWVSSHVLGDVGAVITVQGGGFIVLGGVLDRVRITTVNGTDTFTVGTVNILYE